MTNNRTHPQTSQGLGCEACSMGGQVKANPDAAGFYHIKSPLAGYPQREESWGEGEGLREQS